MTEPDELKVVEFGRKEVDPDTEAAYAAKIAAAKAKGGVNSLKGTTPVGHVDKLSGLPPLQKRGAADQAPAGLQDGGVSPRPVGSPLLSAQTQQQLEEMQKVQGQQIAEEAKAEEAKKAEDPDVFDVFDFYGRSEAERVLNNKKRRKDIESRCATMSFEDLLMKDEVRQLVHILPDKFVVEFRSLRPSESLFIKQYMAKEESKTESYLGEKYSMCQLAMAVVSISGKVLGAPHLNDDDQVNEKVFETRLKMLLKKSGYIVADLAINYTWFDVRVRKLLNPDDLGNG